MPACSATLWPRQVTISALLGGVCFASFAVGQQTDKPESYVYRRVDDVKLELQVYSPAQAPRQPRAAVVFFFGGGWRSGKVSQFAPHCRHLAEMGVVGVTVDYRVRSRHDSEVRDSVQDALRAVAWVREHADELHVDPNRIATAGGSAGGHLAACVGLLPRRALNEDIPLETLKRGKEVDDAPWRPNAMLLFNPAVIVAPTEGMSARERDKLEQLHKFFGTDEPERLSPYHWIAANAAPTIIFHGKADRTVPYSSVEAFTLRMRQVGAKCNLVGYDDEGHGFFNHKRGDGSAYKDTVRRMDDFLKRNGFFPKDE